MNLLETISPDPLSMGTLQWDHVPPRWESLPGGGLRVTAPGHSDYFQSPDGSNIGNDNAPYLWMNMAGDFIARALVKPAFTTTYDAGALMARFDAKNWAKLCFEATDFGTHAAVSVVTRGVSDDANGVDLSFGEVWLQMARTSNLFGLHYSMDGKNWRMVRLFNLNVPAEIKVGLVTQSPIGPGTTVDFLHFSLEQRTLSNIRSGNES